MSSGEEKSYLKCACCCGCWKDFVDMVNFNGKQNIGINLLKASSFALLISFILLFIYWIFERLCCPRKKEAYRDPTDGADFEGHTHKMASIEVAEVDGELQENAEIAKEDAHFGGKKAHAKAVFGQASTNTFTFTLNTHQTEEISESEEESSEEEKKSKKKKKKKKDKKKKKKKDKKKKKKKKKKRSSSSDSEEDSS